MPKGYWIAHNDIHDPETYKTVSYTHLTLPTKA